MSAGPAVATLPPAPRLSERPDWFYLLREFHALYGQGCDGGSRVIRQHRRAVRGALSATFDADPAVWSRRPDVRPVVGHLSRALDVGERGAMQGMARALREVRDALTWEYGYEKMPRALARKYAYAEVLGPRGPVPSEALILGIVLFAPDTTYPQHSHSEVEESYVSIAGAWSENNAAVYAPGSLILNRSGEEHRITTGGGEPCLLAYAWIGPPGALAGQEMKFSGPRRR
ncbi:dimethylsulfonioproprionate lyase family protein [Jannaschia sp. LMIT008]|uniref:dimethylsulfonioproprionate lyase family protein n=1 Tax=Jannaschia maritima TaxID=3032585 RepID=UPI0028128B16|nr:dimethylsulfonioproprionate lyase family protein [Jannaschia sp. LMIT008]